MVNPLQPSRPGSNRPSPAAAWRAVLGRLQLEMPREHFDTFLQPCVGHAWEGGDLVVAAANSFVVTWLELPLHVTMARDALTRALQREAGVIYRVIPGVVDAAPHAPQDTVVTAITASPAVAPLPDPP